MQRWDDGLRMNDKQRLNDPDAARRVEAHYRARHRRGPSVFFLVLLRVCGLIAIATGMYMIGFMQDWILKYIGGLILILGSAIFSFVPAVVFRLWVGMQLREKASS